MAGRCAGSNVRARQLLPDEVNETIASQTHTHYRITFKAQPDAVPEIVRLRRLLKTALRAYRFQCLAIEEFQTPPQTQASVTEGNTLSRGTPTSELQSPQKRTVQIQHRAKTDTGVEMGEQSGHPSLPFVH
jgi:hypothetical protein